MVTASFVPKRGKMTARVFDNPHVGIPPTLFFDVEIPLRAFNYEGVTQKTAVCLDFIDFGVEDWRELPDREFTFPKNPKKGYIDGSVYLAGAHNPVDATRVRFGALKGRTLPATIDLEIDFTYEGLDKLGGGGRLTWEVALGVNPRALDAVIEEARKVVMKRKKAGRRPRQP